MMTESDFGFAEMFAMYPEDIKEKREIIDHDFALEKESVILAVGGFRMITDKTAWSWILLTKHASTNERLVNLFRTLKEFTEQFCKDNKIRRLQAWVKVGFEEGVRTVEHLGYKRESIMHHFIDDEPAYLYVKIMEN